VPIWPPLSWENEASEAGRYDGLPEERKIQKLLHFFLKYKGKLVERMFEEGRLPWS
jgi:hypothetical protein